MAFTIMLKFLLSMTTGLLFWFFVFMVFMVYSFMPVTKTANSIIFAVLAPLLYLGLINFTLKKLFKERVWRDLLINFAVTVLSMGLSLYVIDLTSRILE